MAKGAVYEKKIAKKLSNWLTDNNNQDVFYKSHGSGSRFTARNTCKNAAGDLQCDDEIGRKFLDTFLIEIKRGYDGLKKFKSKEIKLMIEELNHLSISASTKRLTAFINKYRRRQTDSIDLLDIIDSLNRKTDPIITQWLKKAYMECEQAQRQYVLLFFKRDRKDDCVIFPYEMFDEKKDGLLNFFSEHIKFPFIFHGNSEVMCVSTTENFLANLNKNLFLPNKKIKILKGKKNDQQNKTR